jgi:nucleoside-diphosphate-sugar epimerase
MRILITGANGFVGHALCAEVLRRGMSVKGAVRFSGDLPAGVEPMVVGPIDGETDWAEALRGVDVVIHLAARVHVMKDTAADPLAEFLRVNLHGTEQLARQAAQAGVKRLVYVSSIKVNGERTSEERLFAETDEPNPQDPYGISKWQAEQALQRIAHETGLEVVIVRPPLVYGPGVKGNFIKLLATVDKGIPLPLAGANKPRSMIYVGNLIDALIACATHPGAVNQVYLVSDTQDVSVAELSKTISLGLGRPNRWFYFPLSWLRTLGKILGKSAQVDRLVTPLCIDPGKIQRELGWLPPFTLQEGIRATVAWYREDRHICQPK